MPTTKKSGSSAPSKRGLSGAFTAEELAAMKEHADEVKAERRRGSMTQAEADGVLLAKLAEMSDADRLLGERLHAIVRANAPTLEAKLWYGMPAYARDGKVVCFFQPADKFKARYATLGFSDQAHLDDGPLWPTSFALAELDATAEAQIIELVRRAVG